MEFNGEVPAAPAYNDVLSELFLGLPIMREFLHSHEVRALPARHTTMHTLIDSYQRWLGRHERPRIAILDWREVPTYSEFVLFEDYFTSQGYECRIVDPREVEYRGGKLVAGDYTIDLIYKRVLISELVERCGLDSPVVRAVADRAVCMVNPFRCKILHKKASLAVLSDERNAEIFSEEERETIAVHIPWTRRVEDRTTIHNGNSGRSAPLHRPVPRKPRPQGERRVRRQGDLPRLGDRRRRSGTRRSARRSNSHSWCRSASRCPPSRTPAMSMASSRSSTGCRTPTPTSSTATTWMAA